MKAITAVCATGASVPAIVNGRVSRHRDGENAEIQMYLSKLKDLVPYMPRNRKLSKLEIIQHVIDYICDLQSELETHPAVNHFDAAAALNEQQNQQQQQQQHHHHHQQQQQNNQIMNNKNQADNISTAADASRINYSNQYQHYQQHGNNVSVVASSQTILPSSSLSSSILSSSPVRQPLTDRPAPNTILSSTYNNPLSSSSVVFNAHQSNHLTNNSSHHFHTTTEKESMDRLYQC